MFFVQHNKLQDFTDRYSLLVTKDHDLQAEGVLSELIAKTPRIKSLFTTRLYPMKY
jgi:hypothetical protein